MEADLLQYFKVMMIYSLQPDFDNQEELTEVDKIQLTNKGIISDYQTDYGYINLADDNVLRAEPRCFIPKDKDGERKNRKFYTEVIMKSGDIFYVVGKPETFYEELNKYYITIQEFSKQ